MDIQTLWATIGAYALTGAIISSLIQWTKAWINSRSGKILWTALISLILGAGVYYAQLIPGSVLIVVAGIFSAANTVYALFFKGTEK